MSLPKSFFKQKYKGFKYPLNTRQSIKKQIFKQQKQLLIIHKNELLL